jgi:hypothetical protein
MKKLLLLETYFEEATEGEDPLAMIIQNNPKFKIGFVPSPANTKDSVYYISTGQRGVNYTLRVQYLEFAGRGELKERDYYVANLSANPEKAALRAEKEAPQNKIIYYHPLDLEQRAKASAPDIIKFGKKHPGESIHDVALEDPGYVAWIANDLEKPAAWINKPKQKTFKRELLKAIEVPEVAEILGQNRKKQEEQEKKHEKWKAEKETNKERFEPIARALDRAYGDFAAAMAEKIRNGENPADWSDRMFDITADIYAKQASGGKRKNSKDFKEKRKEFFDILGIE